MSAHDDGHPWGVGRAGCQQCAPPAICEEPGCEGGDIEGDDGTSGVCPVCEGSGEAFR